MCAGRGEDDATFSVHLGENEEESGRRTGRERRIPTAAQRRKEWKWSGEEKLVTLLQDFCSRRCHCQEIERWRGREEGGRARGGRESEQASTFFLSLLSCGGEFSLAAQTFLRPALPQQENCLLKFNLENSSAPLSRPREDHGAGEARPWMCMPLHVSTPHWGSGINGTEGYGEQRLLRKIVT